MKIHLCYQRHPTPQSGLTLLEIIIASAILLILASASLPVFRYTVVRHKEFELRRDLRQMRDAIDRYKDYSDRGLIRVEAGSEGYPPDLDTLVKGVNVVSQTGAGIPGATTPGQPLVPSTGFGGAFGQTPGQSGSGQDLIRHVRLLLRIPVDPMTAHAEWGMRSVQDDPDSTSWGGKNVFD